MNGIVELVKNATLSIRISPDLKDRLEVLAAGAGLSVASYTERALRIHDAPPQWVLDGPELIHSLLNGAMVKLKVATGLPDALLTPEHAATLGRQLLHVVQVAAATPSGSRSRIEACVRDVLEIAAKDDLSRDRRLLSAHARINTFLSDLDAHLQEWPNQDRGSWIGKLEDALTVAADRALSEPLVNEVLERAIDHLQRRRWSKKEGSR